MTNEQLLHNLAEKFLEKAQYYSKLTLEENDNTYMKVYYGAIMKSMEESCIIFNEAVKELNK